MYYWSTWVPCVAYMDLGVVFLIKMAQAYSATICIAFHHMLTSSAYLAQGLGPHPTARTPCNATCMLNPAMDAAALF